MIMVGVILYIVIFISTRLARNSNGKISINFAAQNDRQGS